MLDRWKFGNDIRGKTNCLINTVEQRREELKKSISYRDKEEYGSVMRIQLP